MLGARSACASGHARAYAHAGLRLAALGVQPWIVCVYGYQGCAVTGAPGVGMDARPGMGTSTGARGEELGDSGLA